MKKSLSAKRMRMLIPAWIVEPSPYGRHEVAVPTWLHYVPTEPMAVELRFRRHDGSLVEWRFARDLLINGMFMPSGCGDVHVWPLDDGRHVRLTLSSPSGRADFNLRRRALKAAADRMLALVPAGAEHQAIHWDRELGQLLH